MFFLVTLLFFLPTALAIALPSAAPVRPAPGKITLSSLDVDLDGGGCKPGEASVALAVDNSALTVLFDNFSAADGPKAVGSKTRAFCRVNIGINMPGWAFDVQSADFRGYVYVEKGVEASLVSRWKWIDKSGKDLVGKVRKTTPLLYSFTKETAPMGRLIYTCSGKHPQDCQRAG